eukprot:4103145-Pleurochrysis_carterae.AAC.1
MRGQFTPQRRQQAVAVAAVRLRFAIGVFLGCLVQVDLSVSRNTVDTVSAEDSSVSARGAL